MQNTPREISNGASAEFSNDARTDNPLPPQDSDGCKPKRGGGQKAKQRDKRQQKKNKNESRKKDNTSLSEEFECDAPASPMSYADINAIQKSPVETELMGLSVQSQTEFQAEEKYFGWNPAEIKEDAKKQDEMMKHAHDLSFKQVPEYWTTISDNDFCNLLKLKIALYFFKNGVKSYIFEKVKSFQKTFEKRACQNMKPCSTQEFIHCPTSGVCYTGKDNKCSFHTSKTNQKPCQACNKICQLIKDNITHHNFQISWKNTNARWRGDVVQLAKCYLPPDGYTNVTTEDDIDFNGLLSVMINFKIVFGSLTSDGQSRLYEARNIGRKERHSGTNKISDNELDEYFGTLVYILEDEKNLKKNRDAKKAAGILKQFQKDKVDISTKDAINAFNDIIIEVRDSMRMAIDEKSKEFKKMILNLLIKTKNILSDHQETKVCELNAALKSALEEIDQKKKDGVMEIEQKIKDGRTKIEYQTEQGMKQLESKTNEVENMLEKAESLKAAITEKEKRTEKTKDGDSPPQASGGIPPQELPSYLENNLQPAGRNPLPDKMKDFMLLYSEDDQKEALEFADHLIQDIDVQGMTVDPFDYIDIKDTHLGSAESLREKYNYILVFVTKNFKYNNFKRFLAEAIHTDALRDPHEKGHRVIPVWTSHKSKDMIFHLKPLKGFEYFRILEDKNSQASKNYINCVRNEVLGGRGEPK